MTVTWAILRAFLIDRGISVQSIDVGDGYCLIALDGPFQLQCTMPKDGGADVIDFETNFLPEANKGVVQRVSQSLGKDRYSTSPRMLQFSAAPGVTTTHDKLIDAALAVQGGKLRVYDATRLDWISCLVIDRDGVLGIPPGMPGMNYTPDGYPILSQYIPEWAVFPDEMNELVDVSVGQLPAPGLVFRLVYHSHASATVPAVGILNIISHQVGA